MRSLILDANVAYALSTVLSDFPSHRRQYMTVQNYTRYVRWASERAVDWQLPRVDLVEYVAFKLGQELRTRDRQRVVLHEPGLALIPQGGAVLRIPLLGSPLASLTRRPPGRPPRTRAVLGADEGPPVDQEAPPVVVRARVGGSCWNLVRGRDMKTRRLTDIWSCQAREAGAVRNRQLDPVVCGREVR